MQCNRTVVIGRTTFHCLRMAGHEEEWHEGSGNCGGQEVRIRFDGHEDDPQKNVAIIRTSIRGAGVVEYEINNPTQERINEHFLAITRDGYRFNGSAGRVTWYPPHRIEKVEAIWDGWVVLYPDKMRTP